MSVSLAEVLVTAVLFLTVVFAIGLVPIYYVKKNANRQEQYLTMFSLFGVGMLLGTAFMLVIPEGIDACLEHKGNVGLNLLIGFLVVYFLDNFASTVTRTAGSTRWGSFLQERQEILSIREILNPRKSASLVIKNQVVFALVVHGCSDGLAMGASASNDSVKFATLIAIVIHKIPAVLSLSSVMVTRQQLPTLEAVSNLLAFAASTPAAYLCISILNLKKSEALEWVSGNILLMSGGSLLYAAVSALLAKHETPTGATNYRDAELLLTDSTAQDTTSKDMTPFELVSISTEPELPYGETLYVVCGVIVPIVVSFFVRENN